MGWMSAKRGLDSGAKRGRSHFKMKMTSSCQFGDATLPERGITLKTGADGRTVLGKRRGHVTKNGDQKWSRVCPFTGKDMY
jgi:hypothetical protein